jgi:UDP-2,3-diacylglucosamine hydrolase
MRAVFFSDTHLSEKNNGTAQYVEGFVREVCGRADMVFVLGDLFEFYHGYDGYIYPWYKSVVDALKEIVDQGKTVHFVEGNHEFQMGRYFESYTGIRCSQSLEIDLEGKKVFITHGDEFSRYSFSRLFKWRAVSALMDLFGPSLSWKMAMVVRFLLSNKKKRRNDNVRKRFRSYAQQTLDAGYDVVVLAHSHISDRCEFEYKKEKRLYLNTGDLIRHGSYVEYASESGFTIGKYPPIQPF